MTVKLEDKKIKVLCEYNTDFIRKAKMIQGKWDGKYWVFPEDNITEVKALLLDIYGENGDPQEYVNIIVDISYLEESGGSIQLGGRTLVRRRSRDSDVTLGDGVMLIEGNFPSCSGSRRCPNVNAERGTKVKVKSFPLSMYERIKDEPYVELCENNHPQTVINDSPQKDKKKYTKEELLREQQELLARVLEIENLLKEYQDEQESTE